METNRILLPLIPLLVVAIFLVASMVYVRRTGGRGTHVMVRCRDGHLFTTIWIPGVSLKAVRLGPIRYQFCPVGHHWTFVNLVNINDLTDEEKRYAARHHDSNIP